MALSRDLLALALELVNVPEDNLQDVRARRAISTAYYALFHLILESVAIQVVTAEFPMLGLRVGRTISHADIRDVCRSFADGKVPRFLQGQLSSIPQDATVFGKYFLDLQEQRHQADYDSSIPQTTYAAIEATLSASAAFFLWADIRGSSAGTAIVLTFMAARHYRG